MLKKKREKKGGRWLIFIVSRNALCEFQDIGEGNGSEVVEVVQIRHAGRMNKESSCFLP